MNEDSDIKEFFKEIYRVVVWKTKCNIEVPIYFSPIFCNNDFIVYVFYVNYAILMIIMKRHHWGTLFKIYGF